MAGVEATSGAYRVVRAGEVVAARGAWALLVLEGAAQVCMGDTVFAVTGGYFNGAPDAGDGSPEGAAEIRAGRGGRGILLLLDAGADLPMGVAVLLEEAVRAVAEEAFFAPGRDERLRRAAAVFLLQLLRYAPVDVEDATMAEGNDGAAMLAAAAGAVLPPLPEDPVLRRACQLLRQTPQRAWTLEELARQCQMSRRGLIAAFARAGLLAPLRYLAQVRVALACRLLAENEQVIAYIAAQCGYADVAGFSHFFRRHTGKSPRQYRQDTAWLS